MGEGARCGLYVCILHTKENEKKKQVYTNIEFIMRKWDNSNAKAICRPSGISIEIGV